MNSSSPPSSGASNADAPSFTQAAQAKAWCDALPLGHPLETAAALIAALKRLNHAPPPSADHYHILEVLRPFVADRVDTLRKAYAGASLPLAERPLQNALCVEGLLTETSQGYKLVVIQSTTGGTLPDALREVVLAAVYHGINALGRLLVETYTVYAPEPPQVWRDLHRLYYFAEQRGLEALPLKIENSETANPTVGQAYRRAILLSLANPYHLMHGEALSLYKEVDKWTAACRLTPMHGPQAHKGQLYVDLATDLPPRYAPPKLDIPAPQEARMIDISAMRGIINKRIQEIVTAAKSNPKGQSTLAERTQIYMYRRLAEAWGVRSERLSTRHRREMPMEIIAGISASHHFLAGSKRFTPEDDEIRIRREQSGKSGPELSLLPAEHSPWVHENEAARLAKGVVKPRTSQFHSAVDRDDKDIWVKVYSSAVHVEDDASAEPTFRVAICQQRDESKGGIAISCPRGHGIQVRVGEVLGYKNGVDDRLWAIGTVRWIRTSDNNLELGIRVLAEDAAAVAVKGLKGVGQGGEYFRALLIPNLDPRHYPTTLITPAAIYDIDSVILLNTGKDLVHVRLTKLLEATGSYARFQFVRIAASEIHLTEPHGSRAGKMIR